MWHLPTRFYQERGEKYRGHEDWGYYLEDSSYNGRYLSEELERLEDREYSDWFGGADDPGSVRYDLRNLNRKLKPESGLLSQNRWWSGLGDLVKTYLKSRVLDITRYGTVVADKTFPQPAIKGVASGEVSQCVSGMAKSILEEWERHKTEKENDYFAEREKEASLKCDQEYHKQVVAVPANLASRVLSGYENEEAIRACRMEVEKSEAAKAMLEIVDQFASFCTLLSRPENHIMVPTGQYVDKAYNIRHEDDMKNEMARELVNLPRYTAFAKVVKERGGEQKDWKGKIRTVKLGAVPEGSAEARTALIQALENAPYLRRREQIEEEIRERRNKMAKNDHRRPEWYLDR
jgi:hypothetical protein